MPSTSKQQVSFLDQICSQGNCGKPSNAARGLCQMHYRRLRFGQPMGPGPIVKPWSETEIAWLAAAYRAVADEDLQLGKLAVRIGRSKANICRKARELGLTNHKRPGVINRKTRLPMYPDAIARRAAQSARQKAWIQKNGHPRGALGMKHTPEAKAVMSEKSKLMWADPNHYMNSDAAAQKRSDNLLTRIKAGLMRGGWYSRAKGGKRADLDNTYFRSSWEANYARYLNLLVARREIALWEYEPKTFVFESIKRGNRAYTPDFRIVFADGTHEWHEVKGWMDHNSRLRLERMAKFYPEEIVKVIAQPWFKQAVRGGLSAIIPGWEKGSV